MSNTSQPTAPTVGFVSLGCAKNLVDSEVMMGLLDRAGARLTQRAEDAEILVVNTCSFIDSAKQESVDAILEMARHKTEGRAQRLIVAGCLVERYRDEIQKNIPEVDAVGRDLGDEIPGDRVVDGGSAVRRVPTAFHVTAQHRHLRSLSSPSLRRIIYIPTIRYCNIRAW